MQCVGTNLRRSGINQLIEIQTSTLLPKINVKVLEKETKDFPRKVLEAIHIRKKGPNLNRDKGLDLDPVWDNLVKPTKTRGTKTEHQSILMSQ